MTQPPNPARRHALLLAATLVATTVLAGVTPATAAESRTVLVAGATGKTGRLVVKDLLASGYTVRALVRDPARAREILGEQVQVMQGDVKDPASLKSAATGVAAVISAIGAKSAKGPDSPEAVDYGGVKNLVDAAAAAGVRQFVLVSSRSVTQKDNPLNKMFGNVLVWKLKGEDYLRASGIPYTVVRPGGLTDAPGGEKKIVFEQGDREAQSSIARADVARVCVEALQYPEARNRTFEIGTTAGAPVSDWRGAFAALEPDPG